MFLQEQWLVPCSTDYKVNRMYRMIWGIGVAMSTIFSLAIKRS